MGGPEALGTLQITVEGDLASAVVARIRARLASLARYSRRPPQSARVAIRVGGASRGARRFYVADASLLVGGTYLVAHAVGPSPEMATKEVCLRLRRQLRDAVDAVVARRNDPAVLRKAASDLELEARPRPRARLKPPQEREIVTFLKVPGEPESTFGAVAELIDRDYEFNLFRHAASAEDVVVHRRADDAVGLLHPPGSPLRHERRDMVIPEPSRYSEPIALVDARLEMDALGHRFIYFIALDDRRGKVLYLRRDGDYGLVELS
jgi:ribosome-associated translation inhibitor RaiA